MKDMAELDPCQDRQAFFLRWILWTKTSEGLKFDIIIFLTRNYLSFTVGSPPADVNRNGSKNQEEP